MGDEAKALDFILQAEKKLKGRWLIGTTQADYEDAAELFQRAANAYKNLKKWQEAGNAFIRSSESYAKLGSHHDEASALVSAASSLRKIKPKEAAECLSRAVEIFADMGRFSMAAKHEKDVAEIYESDLVDVDAAMAAYQRAADWYAGEDSKTSANNCLLKVALFAAQLEKYNEAIAIYEELAAASIDNNLMRYSVKDYLFRAAVCRLARGDVVDAQNALKRYQDMDPTFGGTRESAFLENIAADVENGDVEEFTNHVVEFDNLSKLDNWKTMILLRVKKNIREEPSVI